MSDKLINIQQKGVDAVLDKLKQAAETIDRETKRTLQYLGEETVRFARDRAAEDSWIDRTGNLRSSIGYVIVDGAHKVAQSDFQSVGNSTEGSTTGQEYAEEVARRVATANEQTLVVVAGMNYASDVEAIESKDVLATPKLFAESKRQKYEAMTRSRIEQMLQ